MEGNVGVFGAVVNSIKSVLFGGLLVLVLSARSTRDGAPAGSTRPGGEAPLSARLDDSTMSDAGP